MDNVMVGRRVLVVGASSGIGAALARAVVAHGGQVAVTARRAELLDELAGDIGAHALPGDATDRESMAEVTARAAEVMGGLDLMVYVAGYGVLQRIEDCDPETWMGVYRVNVLGANIAAAAAMEHMDRDGVMAFISSRTVEDANPIFGSYSTSKAAMDQSIRTWRKEHPDRRFVRIVMGNCQPTDFANQMGFELLGEALEAWDRERVPGGMMHVDDVGQAVTKALAVSLDHPDIDASELKFDARRA